MRPPGVVEAEVSSQARLRFGGRVVGAQIDFLVLQALPQSLDKDVVAPAAFATDPDGVRLEQPGEFRTDATSPQFE